MKLPKGLKIGIVAGACAAICAAVPVVANPGSADDPLISQSYIDTVLMPQIRQMINNNSGGGTVAQNFEIINMKAGQKMICDGSTELILRGGDATIIASEKGGIANTTKGWDLANGEIMPANNLLIVPVGDGRGIWAKTDAIVMVKGGYKIQ